MVNNLTLTSLTEALGLLRQRRVILVDLGSSNKAFESGQVLLCLDVSTDLLEM